MSVTNWAWARNYPPRSSSCSASASSATPPRFGAGCSGRDVSQDPPNAEQPPEREAPARRGRHELPADRPRPEIGAVHRTGLSGLRRGGRSRLAFGTLAILLCLVLGVAIVTQVRETKSGDSLDTARP